MAEADAPTPPSTPFDRMGGKPVIAEIVDRFYDLMESDAAYAELRAMHAPDLAKMRHSLAGFLAAWSGGPRDWFQDNPGKCMMSMHKPFVISKAVAGQWSDAMKRAIGDAGIENAYLAKAMGGVLEEMAQGMARD